MFTPGTTSPKLGEIRLGYIEPGTPSPTHKYVGLHPYLVISNDQYNKHSGQCEVIPFTTKRYSRPSCSHVNFQLGEVDGLRRDSTLVVESRDILRHTQLSDPIGLFTKDNWQRVIPAILAQNPFLVDYISQDEKSQMQQEFAAVSC